MDSVFQFWSGNYSGILAEKLKNWKTVFSREIQEEILHMDSVFQFFSFIASYRAGTTVNVFWESLHYMYINPPHVLPQIFQRVQGVEGDMPESILVNGTSMGHIRGPSQGFAFKIMSSRSSKRRFPFIINTLSFLNRSFGWFIFFLTKTPTEHL